MLTNSVGGQARTNADLQTVAGGVGDVRQAVQFVVD